MIVYKTRWAVFEDMIKKTVGDAGVSILILLLIGMMSATWMVSGMTQSTVFGFPTLVYLPFCFFNIISPLMSCLVAILGFVPKPK